MATEVTKTIKPSGGDYTSLSAWEAARQRDLTSVDEIEIAECYSEDDTADCHIDGWTTDSTRYIKIYTPTAERHDGKWNTSKYRLTGASGSYGKLVTWEENVRIDGLQVENYGGTGGRYAIRGLATGVCDHRVSNCIVKANPYGNDDNGGYDFGPTGVTAGSVLRIWNCIAYDFHSNGSYGNTAMGYSFWSNYTAYCYNNLAHNTDNGFMMWTNNCIAKNCVAYASPTGSGVDFRMIGSGWGSGTDYNASGDATAPGTTKYTGITVTFVNEAGDDFHITTGDTGIKDRGTDLSGDANLPFSTDIDGDTRTVPWCIGPDEIDSPAVSGSPWYAIAQM